MESRGMTRREERARLERDRLERDREAAESQSLEQQPTPADGVRPAPTVGSRLRAVATGVGAALAIAFFIAAAIHYTSQPAPMPGADYGSSSEPPPQVDQPVAETVAEPGSPFSIGAPGPALSSAGPLKVALLGDSVAGNMHQALRDHRSTDLDLSLMASGGCGLFDATKARAGNGWVMDSEEKGCGKWKDDLRGLTPGEQPDVILVHNKWDVEDQLFEGSWIGPCEDAWEKRYHQQLETLTGITDVFASPPLILLSNDRPRDWSKTVSPERLACKSAVEETIFAAHSNVQRLDLSGAVCPDDVCVTDVSPGVALYADDRVHFTPAAKQVMAPWIENRIAEALSGLGRL
ncbi:SGNH hydrolase domain-containing protein [Microbacterium sp. NPDC055988]|uniref:SGNH hydrolase domain-containing protein n=1 Tax=Microbacterium sp. NPDC055988 TaxID=3345671 RepID=UPI0035E00904